LIHGIVDRRLDPVLGEFSTVPMSRRGGPLLFRAAVLMTSMWGTSTLSDGSACGPKSNRP
jgi:hypothetical protein